MSKSDYFLTSERLGFRHWKEDDLELAIGLWSDYRVTKLFDARGPLSREQVKSRLKAEIDSQLQFGLQYWPVFHLRASDHIGCAGLRPCGHSGDTAEIGFHIRPSFWRQGYAFEAARALIKFTFGDLIYTALFAGHNPQNHASGKLLQKLGFNYTHDEFYEPTGLQHPSYLLTKEQYLKSRLQTPDPVGGL